MCTLIPINAHHNTARLKSEKLEHYAACTHNHSLHACIYYTYMYTILYLHPGTEFIPTIMYVHVHVTDWCHPPQLIHVATQPILTVQGELKLLNSRSSLSNSFVCAVFQLYYFCRKNKGLLISFSQATQLFLCLIMNR